MDIIKNENNKYLKITLNKKGHSMKVLYFLSFIFLLTACNLNEITSEVEPSEEESAMSAKDATSASKEFNLTSFARVSELDGQPTCYFSLTKTAFEDQQYIYVGINEKQKSFMQVNGGLQEFSCQMKEEKDSLLIQTHNDDLELFIKAKKESSTPNAIQYVGEITILKNGEKQLVSSVYGECDC